MTRRDWTAVALAIYAVRRQPNGTAAEALDAVTDAIAKVLDERSSRFDVARFRALAGA